MLDKLLNGIDTCFSIINTICHYYVFLIETFLLILILMQHLHLAAWAVADLLDVLKGIIFML